MFRVLIVGFVFFILSCGATKQNNTSDTSENKTVLPPNTASNKYSKLRQN